MTMIEPFEEAISLIIAAAGKGTRLNTGNPKAFTSFKNSHFLELMLNKTQNIFNETIVVCNELHVERFTEYKLKSKIDWSLSSQVGGIGSLFAVLSGIDKAANRKVIVCWVDQVGLDRQIFLDIKKNFQNPETKLTFPILHSARPYVQAIISSGKLEKWKFRRENEETEDGFTDCGIFGIETESLQNFIKECKNLQIYQSSSTGEINFLSVLPDFQMKYKSKIWEVNNSLYSTGVNTLEELQIAEKLL
jgi:molybdopterin-guanine dinucleotide biosynthesis protein A